LEFPAMNFVTCLDAALDRSSADTGSVTVDTLVPDRNPKTRAVVLVDFIVKEYESKGVNLKREFKRVNLLFFLKFI